MAITRASMVKQITKPPMKKKKKKKKKKKSKVQIAVHKADKLYI